MYHTLRVMNHNVKHIFSVDWQFKCVLVPALWHRMELLLAVWLHLADCQQLDWELKSDWETIWRDNGRGEILNQAGDCAIVCVYTCALLYKYKRAEITYEILYQLFISLVSLAMLWLHISWRNDSNPNLEYIN